MKRWCRATGCTKRAREGDWCAEHEPKMAPRSFSVEPLVALIQQRGGLTACSRDRSLHKAYHRGVASGSFSGVVADRLAFGFLGLHPWEVWTEWFGDAHRSASQTSPTIDA